MKYSLRGITKHYEDIEALRGIDLTIGDEVLGIIDRHLGTAVDWSEIEQLGVLGIDEIALKKGHRDYVVIVTARLNDGQVKLLAVLPASPYWCVQEPAPGATGLVTTQKAPAAVAWLWKSILAVSSQLSIASTPDAGPTSSAALSRGRRRRTISAAWPGQSPSNSIRSETMRLAKLLG